MLKNRLMFRFRFMFIVTVKGMDMVRVWVGVRFKIRVRIKVMVWRVMVSGMVRYNLSHYQKVLANLHVLASSTYSFLGLGVRGYG